MANSNETMGVDELASQAMWKTEDITFSETHQKCMILSSVCIAYTRLLVHATTVRFHTNPDNRSVRLSGPSSQTGMTCSVSLGVNTVRKS